MWASFATAAAPACADWMRKLENPQDAQAQRLTQLLQKNAATEFGRAHGFSAIRSLAEYQERVPVQTWSEVAPWVDRTLREPTSPLTAETVRFFERTSGSSAARKYIPYTDGLLAEFQRALVVWLYELYRSCPGVAAGRSYWALSPAGLPPEVAPNGAQIGGISDAVYVQGSAAEPLLYTAIMPSWSSGASWRMATLRALIEAEDLAFLSLWSPTFLSALLQPMLGSTSALAELSAGLPSRRLSRLERSLADGNFSALWPNLAAISVWMDGPSAGSAVQLRPWFPQSNWCPKGLLATEGVVSFSWGTTGLNVPAIDSHVLEFLDDAGVPRSISELQEGHRYRPLISTSGGLYRYKLGDVVEARGQVAATPCLKFIGRDDARCDLVGEKLDESLVAAAFSRVFGPASSACLVPMPDARPCRYLLLSPGSLPLDRARAQVEFELQQVFHYAHARQLGQLAPIEGYTVQDPAMLVQLSWESTGARAGDAKPRALVTSLPHARAIAAAVRRAS